MYLESQARNGSLIKSTNVARIELGELQTILLIEENFLDTYFLNINFNPCTHCLSQIVDIKKFYIIVSADIHFV
jgi:hypothetical protein